MILEMSKKLLHFLTSKQSEMEIFFNFNRFEIKDGKNFLYSKNYLVAEKRDLLIEKDVIFYHKEWYE